MEVLEGDRYLNILLDWKCNTEAVTRELQIFYQSYVVGAFFFAGSSQPVTKKVNNRRLISVFVCFIFIAPSFYWANKEIIIVGKN